MTFNQTASAAALIVVAAAWASACGGSTVIDGDGPSGGSGGSGATGAGGGVGAGGGAGGGEEGCSQFNDEDGQSSVTVRFRNESGQPLYLPANCERVIYEVVASPHDGVHYAFDPFCMQTCQDLQTDAIMDCAACEPSSRRLAAGGSYETVWDGTGMKSRNMPDACWYQNGKYSNGGCGQIVEAPTGSYQIAAVAFADCQAWDGNACACTNEGVCSGEATGAQTAAQPVIIAFPSQGLVELVFGS